MASVIRRIRGVAQVATAHKNQWTPAKRAQFLETLAVTCNVTSACASARMSYNAAYVLRRKDAAFRAGWADAIAIGVDRLELLLLERATNGRVTLRIAADGSESRTIDYPDHIALRLIRDHKADRPAETGEDEEAELAALRAKITRKLDLVARREAKRNGPVETGPVEMGPDERGDGAPNGAVAA